MPDQINGGWGQRICIPTLHVIVCNTIDALITGDSTAGEGVIMRFIIMANGQYGELDYYVPFLHSADHIVCADGGANYAHKLGVNPAAIVGDLDSIHPDVYRFYKEKGIPIKRYPRQKDFTDTQLALNVAEEMGATEIVLMGSMGGRLDHSLSNLYAGIVPTRNGVIVCHVTNDSIIHIFNSGLEIEGAPGDLVSILPLTEEVRQVRTEGLEYALCGETLYIHNPYSVSNVLTEKRAVVRIEDGIAALFHYYVG